MIDIVKMQAEHCRNVAELEAAYFSLPWSESAIRSELENPLAFWLVAVVDAKVVGYVGSQSVMDEADMMNLAVDAAYRRKGIGRQLVNTLISNLKDMRVRSLTLEVRVSNSSAIALYNDMGFEKIGCRPGYYQKPKEDALILRKEWAI